MLNPYRKKAEEAMEKAREKLQTCLPQNASFRITTSPDDLEFRRDQSTMTPCCTMEIPYIGDSEVARCVAEAIRLVYPHMEEPSVSIDGSKIVVSVGSTAIVDDNGKLETVRQVDPGGQLQSVNCSVVDWIIGAKIRDLLRAIAS